MAEQVRIDADRGGGTTRGYSGSDIGDQERKDQSVQPEHAGPACAARRAAARDQVTKGCVTAESSVIAEKVMHHVMNEPIMNEMTGKAKPKAAKLLFFDEARKIEAGAVTLQLGRGYDIAEEYLGEAVEEPIEELIYNAIALTKLDFAQEDLYLT